MLMPKAQHPECTQKFVSLVTEALEVFEDNIGSLEENLQARAYETFINSNKDALRFTAWSRESSFFGADCTKSASLADVVGEWHKICSVRKQFPLFVYKRLTKTTVSFKMNRCSSVMIIAILNYSSHLSHE